MNGKILAAALPLVLAASVAEAGTLRCSFTEPFFTVEFDSATRKVVLVSPDEFDDTGRPIPRVLSETARIRRSGVWETYETYFLETPGKDAATPPEIILEIRVTGRGEDGMSDVVYPFEGRYGEGRLVGGCEATKAHAYDIHEVYQDIGVVEDK
jgi:uncharacterized membrane protein